MTGATLAANLAFSTVLAIAAGQDIRSRTISNAWPAALLLLFPLAVAAGGRSVLVGNAIHFLVALAIGMLAFSRGWIGGGDAKLYAATALWFDLREALMLLALVTVIGAALAIGRGVMQALQAGQRPSEAFKGGAIPYGVAIAGGATGLIWLTNS